MPGYQSAHAYSQYDMDRLRNVALPPKIKCGRCNKSVNQAGFSNKQLTDARSQVLNHGKISKAPNCQKCTNQRPVEIECIMCGKTKGLEEFAKSQRKNSDTAKCFRCTEVQVSQAAIDDELYERFETSFLTPENSAGNCPEYFSSASSTTGTSSSIHDEWASVNGDSKDKGNDAEDGGIALSRHFQKSMAISGSDTEASSELEYAHPPPGNVKGDTSTQSWHTKSLGAMSASSGIGTNTFASRSTAFASGSQHSFGSSTAERSEIRSNGWTKKSAIPLGTTTGGPMMPMGDISRQGESAVNAWDSDEDSEDNDEDDDDNSDDDIVI